MVASNHFHLTLTTLLLTLTTTLSIFFQTSTLPEFPITIDINLTHTTITTHIPLSQQHLFHSIAFSNAKHQNTYTIIQHPTTPYTFTIHQLIPPNSINPNQYPINTSNWIISTQTSNTHIILTLTRANNIGYPYYIFNPNQQSLHITYTSGIDTINLIPNKYITEQLNFISNTMRRLLVNTTSIPTTAPNTPAPTLIYTTLSPTSKTYSAGIKGYIEQGKDWVNNDATQIQLLIICASFAGLLIICLCCCYFIQAKKTKKLEKIVFEFQPDLLKEEREQNQQFNDDNIPFVDAADPDSSIGHNHPDEYIAPPARGDVIEEIIPDDDEANFRKPNPNTDIRKIPTEIANKLEESLSVESFEIGNNNDNNVGKIAPPPPNEPIPNDILEKHRNRAATQMDKKNNIKNDNRRNTYHPNGNNKQRNELEMQIVNNKYDGADDDPPTPVSDHDVMIEDRYKHEKVNSLKNIANKRLSKSNGNGSVSPLPIANKRNNNDPALSLLSEEPMQKERVNVNKNNNENEFDIASPSAKMLFTEEENIDNKKDPFSSIEAEFRALSNVEKEPSQKKRKAEQSGNDIILGMLGDENENENENNDKSNLEESLSIAAEFNALSNNINEVSEKKHKSEQSGNDVILDILGDEKDLEESMSISEGNKSEEIGNNAVLNMLNQEPEPDIKPSHRGKQMDDDPFASLDMGHDLFDNVMENPMNETVAVEEPKDEIKKDKDAEALGVLGGLLNANPEFGDNDNIFGGTGDNAVDAILNSGNASNMVDLQKYTNVKDTVAVDYDKLTKISDTDQYKVVSVQEMVTMDDGHGNIQQLQDKKINENDEITELDNILNDNMINANNNNVEIIAENSVDKMEQELDMHSALDMLINGGDNIEENNNENENDDDPFGGLNDDPFAALNANIGSPLDNIIQTANDNNIENENENNDIFGGLNDNIDNDKEIQQDDNDNDPFAELNVSSPLDNIMQAANDNDDIQQQNEENENDNDPFAELNVSSPLDNIIQAADTDLNNDTSALDNIMNEADNIEEYEEQNDDPFAELNVGSPLDAIMNEADVSDDGNDQVIATINHQTSNVDIDNLIQSGHNNNGSVVFNEDVKDIDHDEEEEEEEEEHSMGSEIIHDTPRVSGVMHEALDPQIFGHQHRDETTSESEYSNGTDPNAY